MSFGPLGIKGEATSPIIHQQGLRRVLARTETSIWFRPVTFPPASIVLFELVSRREGYSTCSLSGARALRSSLIHVYFAMLHHLRFGFEFRTASAALVFFPE